jgi:hypothetical protein
MLSNVKLPSLMAEFKIPTTDSFRHSYIFELLNLPSDQNASELQKALVSK